ncbi:thiamine pyrophosphate-dependent enzyme [Niabella yanshanensis]|uniref:3-methyl-2-oxobutanoate dehydrogenase (2-methylpropanoyl-transferring) n=1 Tax=Niabella yanshanensis TaxID=577386 RepID=A0ABZ0W9N2_9BACT|nr:thiamine pyrophosphate-dependent enzyme [Niabella yanshanensis]WQD39298.1 thiamine pyrophosphate-dependent enzyme [Niabella yanshanensis]
MDILNSGFAEQNEMLSFEKFKDGVLHDYYIACLSRETSLLSRKEVLTGKAKFGIFGDGKEVAQVAAAKFFQPGDWRSGYYRDQTMMFAIGESNPNQYFAQLYADPDPQREPFSHGRQMNCHYTSRNTLPNGEWANLVEIKNTGTDMSSTASQMPRAVGLALASKLFRDVDELKQFKHLSDNGSEVCFCTIGDASTSEGHFWEAVNAAGVLQVPLVIFVWDDGYGISVPREYQTTKGSISKALKGFEKEEGTNGFYIAALKGWDYMSMVEVFNEGISLARETHTPVIFHIEELTQPQGHSTSGSHERYKTRDRLQWEKERDCLVKMKAWILENALADEATLRRIETDARNNVKEAKDKAWKEYQMPLKELTQKSSEVVDALIPDNPEHEEELRKISKDLRSLREPLRKNNLQSVYKALLLCGDKSTNEALDYYKELQNDSAAIYNSLLYDDGPKSALKVEPVAPVYGESSPSLNGYQIINRYFDSVFESNPKVIAFGEDLGQIGDVNQGFAGLQKKYGNERIFDTGIRELTIMGKGVGLALRGLRPIAEIQYLDYLVYGLQPLTDDVASLFYRSGGKQSCPIIVRTRGHRLEGIWHSGSPMGMIINAVRGMFVCVPRNFVQAAGMYNTLLKSNSPAIVIESLNGYRLKEKLPENLSDITIPLGIPEILKEGTDITIVSYGSTIRIVQQAMKLVEPLGVSCELIDVQTLLPFDLNHMILESLKKTNRILFVDEDVPGGAAGFMFNKVMEEQGGYRYLDVAPRTITAKEHRPAYGSDGDYFSKPNAEEVAAALIEMMKE